MRGWTWNEKEKKKNFEWETEEDFIYIYIKCRYKIFLEVGYYPYFNLSSPSHFACVMNE